MIEERAIDLINRAIDNELSESDRVELDEHLAISEAARCYLADLKSMNSLLDNVTARTVPDGLHDKIVSSISLEDPSKKTPASNVKGLPGLVRYGFAAAAGLLVAVGVYQVGLKTNPADTNQMVGTMAPNKTALLGRYSVAINELTSSVRLERHGADIVMQVQLDSAAPAGLRINFSGSNLRFDAMAQTDTELEFSQDGDQVIHISGRGHHEFSVLLRQLQDADNQTEDVIALEYSSNGKVIRQGDLIPLW